MVAAWISADTGVGPAMASGSQTYSGIWADLPAMPRNSASPIQISTGTPPSCVARAGPGSETVAPASGTSRSRSSRNVSVGASSAATTPTGCAPARRSGANAPASDQNSRQRRSGSPASPTRLTRNALRAAWALGRWWYQ